MLRLLIRNILLSEWLSDPRMSSENLETILINTQGLHSINGNDPYVLTPNDSQENIMSPSSEALSPASNGPASVGDSQFKKSNRRRDQERFWKFKFSHVFLGLPKVIFLLEKMRLFLKRRNLKRIVLVMPRPIRWSLSYFEKCPPKNQVVTMQSWKIFKFFFSFFGSNNIFPIRIKEATDGPNPLRAKYKNLEKAWVHLL